MGRPKLDNSRRDVISVAVSRTEAEFMDKLADQYGCSRSFLIRRIIASFTNNFTDADRLSKLIITPKQAEALLSDYNDAEVYKMFPELATN